MKARSSGSSPLVLFPQIPCAVRARSGFFQAASPPPAAVSERSGGRDLQLPALSAAPVCPSLASNYNRSSILDLYNEPSAVDNGRRQRQAQEYAAFLDQQVREKQQRSRRESAERQREKDTDWFFVSSPHSLDRNANTRRPFLAAISNLHAGNSPMPRPAAIVGTQLTATTRSVAIAPYLALASTAGLGTAPLQPLSASTSLSFASSCAVSISGVQTNPRPLASILDSPHHRHVHDDVVADVQLLKVRRVSLSSVSSLSFSLYTYIIYLYLSLVIFLSSPLRKKLFTWRITSNGNVTFDA